MSNLNFESFENKSPKTTSSKSSKKPAKKKQKPPMGIIIGVGIAVILGIVFIFASGSSSDSEKVGTIKKMFLPKPDEYMKTKLLETSRTMEIPATKVWEFYCAHDPEGYLRLLDKKWDAPNEKWAYKGLHWKLQDLTGYGRRFSGIDDMTAMALIEVWKKHPDRDDPYWKTYKDDFSFFASALAGGQRWRTMKIFWTGEEF